LDVPEDDRPTGTPVGKVKTKELLSLKVWVDPEIAEVFRLIEGKSAWVADAIASKLGARQ
jgi:hypothetical protein